MTRPLLRQAAGGYTALSNGAAVTHGYGRQIVGYRPKGGERDTPQVSIAGKWLAEAGFAVGTGANLTVLDGCLLPIPDSREERRLRAMEQQLKAQQQELEQAKQRMIAMLA